MKKTIIYLIVALLLVTITSAIEDCKGINNQADVPCIIFGSYSPANSCNTYTATVFNTNGSKIDTRSLGTYGDTGNCNITFNYTSAGSYSVNMSYGESMRLIVEDKENRYYIYLIALFVITALLILGYAKEESVFLIMSGFIFMTLALHLFLNGFPNLTNEFLKNGIVIILAGCGFYFVLAPSIKYFEDFK